MEAGAGWPSTRFSDASIGKNDTYVASILKIALGALSILCVLSDEGRCIESIVLSQLELCNHREGDIIWLQHLL